MRVLFIESIKRPVIVSLISYYGLHVLQTSKKSKIGWWTTVNYLSYDIHISNPDGRITSLARTLLQRSGGETQTPFYVAIAASFASLYKVGEQLRRPTIRLAIFDEAFSKMDQRYIESALEIFRRFNLQIIAATPPDRRVSYISAGTSRKKITGSHLSIS